MSTPYNSIYDLFLDEITDYTFLDFEDSDRDLILKRLLIKSLSRFHACKNDLSKRDDELEVFEEDLTDEEQMILGYIMKLHWLNQNIYNIELIQQRLSVNDFKQTSQAEHLRVLQLLKDNLDKDISTMIVNYTNYNYSV